MQITPAKQYTLQLSGAELVMVENILRQVPFEQSSPILLSLEQRIKQVPVINPDKEAKRQAQKAAAAKPSPAKTAKW